MHNTYIYIYIYILNYHTVIYIYIYIYIYYIILYYTPPYIFLATDPHKTGSPSSPNRPTAGTSQASGMHIMFDNFPLCISECF